MQLGDILEKLGQLSVKQMTKPRKDSQAQPTYDMPARDPLEQADRDYAPLSRLFGGMVRNTASLPERLFTASEGLRTEQGYDPGPAVELMGSMYGLNAPFNPVGAVGVSGAGRRLGKADFGSILAKQRMKEADQSLIPGPETIKWAAVKDSKGNIYEGNVHNEARKLAVDSGKVKPDDFLHTGFLTSKKRFVSREEAARIAENAHQVEPGYTKNTGWLDAADYYTPDRPAWWHTQQMNPQYSLSLEQLIRDLGKKP